MTLAPLLPFAMLVPLMLLAIAGCVWLAVRRRGQRWPWSLRAGTILVLAAALTRPGTPVEVATAQVESAVDVFVLVDTSSSASAEDWGGGKSRLEGMRGDIGAIIEAVPGGRYSLITFDSTAVPRMPLTTDSSALLTAAEVLRPEVSVYSGGTSIGVAAELLQERLQASAEDRPDSSRVVFYLGDGEQTSPEAPESFSESAPLISDGGVFGYGTAKGGRMLRYTGYDEGKPGEYIRDPSTGGDALSVIDEDALRGVADQLGVGYQLRRAGAAPALDIQVEGTATTQSTDEVGRTEITWMFLVLVFVLLTGDLAIVARQWRQVAQVKPQSRGGKS